MRLINILFIILKIQCLKSNKFPPNSNKEATKNIKKNSEELKNEQDTKPTTSFYINRNESFEYKRYCESKFSNNPQENMKLKKILVINRHGDRMPINYEHRDLFSFISCVSCIEENCSIGVCKEGQLTEKGYEQMESLGKHISEEYQEILIDIKEKDISLRTTVIERTQSSLNGILKGLKRGLIASGTKILFEPEIKIELIQNLDEYTVSNGASLIDEAISDIYPLVTNLVTIESLTPSAEIDSLLYLKPCKATAKILAKDLKMPTIKENVDETLVALCNNIYEPCEKYNCDEDYKNKTIKQYFDAWKLHSLAIKENNFLAKIYFGRFAKELLDFINDSKKMSINSSHDNSISLILSGLKTNFVEKPPLGSAIFLEIWADSENNEFLRIIFNNKILKSDIFDGINIPIRVVKEYAKIMTVDQNELKRMCKLL
ncbi:Counting factor 60 [Cucumispora dikerogammari]|nr:Counting factor 60 [Cucumispora dikerogammari]